MTINIQKIFDDKMREYEEIVRLIENEIEVTAPANQLQVRNISISKEYFILTSRDHKILFSSYVTYITFHHI
jgi:hypothetical protein